MIAWLNNYNLWLAIGGVLDENAITNGTVLLLLGCSIAFATICLSKKLRRKFF